MDRGSNIEENAESGAGPHEDVFHTQDLDQEKNVGENTDKKQDQESNPCSRSSKTRI